ncbi:MAG: DNA polymerase III subunit alpha, partial [Rhodobacteraceae bacterium]|nr:DNA polymerase III subunit alpha [Paracoccaceae bacterium]
EDGRELYKPAEGAENQINAIPLDDEPTYDLYSAAKTVAVFQVESSGMMDALKRMKPTCIEDIVALVALYRPGPMENIPTYCDVKNGKKERESVHPLIDHILEETQGIIVYQEQVMQIAQVMAGYSLGGADLLRRAMGKKIKEAMDAEVVSYQTAWLKANHPVEFMAGVMNCDIHLTDKLAVYFEEVRKGLGLKYVPPCVNRSEASFDVVDGALVYALGALKNVGIEAMRLITEARGDKPFVSLFDFARRVDLKRVGKRPLEMLARAGAFDVLDANRRRVFESLEGLVFYSAAIAEQKSSNQVSLFGEAGEDLPEPRLAPVTDWLPAERLSEEFRAVGFYLSGHPLDDYLVALKRKGVMTLDEVMHKAQSGPTVAKLAGVVAGRQERKSARGNRFAFCQLSDPTGAYEVTLFSEALEKSREHLETGQKVVITAEATMEADQLKFLGRSVAPVDIAVADLGSKGLRIFVEAEAAFPAISSILDQANSQSGTKGPVFLCLLNSELPGEVELDVGQDFVVNPQIKGALKSLPGVLEVEDA